MAGLNVDRGFYINFQMKQQGVNNPVIDRLDSCNEMQQNGKKGKKQQQ